EPRPPCLLRRSLQYNVPNLPPLVQSLARRCRSDWCLTCGNQMILVTGLIGGAIYKNQFTERLRVKGDAKIIALLNQVLKAELTAINQYFLHAEMCENWGYEKLAKHTRDE